MADVDMTNWDRIRAYVSGAPGVYCFGSVARMEDDWLTRFRRQARERGFSTSVEDGNLYIRLETSHG